jgi:hypothetical protein
MQAVKFRSLYLLLIATLGALAFTAHANDAPLPEDVRVAKPGAGVPSEMARWSGQWAGSWDGELASRMVVERMAASGKGECLYSWGQNLGWGINAGYSRVTCQVAEDGGSIVLAKFRNGAVATFYFQTNNKLTASYERKGQITRGSFTRQP